MTKSVFAFAALLGAALTNVQAAQGFLYDGGLNSHAIYRFTPAGVRTTFYTTASLNADWLAFDSKGNLFVADAGSSSILKITPAGSATTFASGILPGGLAFDAAGNLFAIDSATNSILKFTPAGTRTTFKSGLTGSAALAFDKSGNLFVTLRGSGAAGSGSIAKITPAGVLTTFATGLFEPMGIVVDNANTVYEADFGSGSIFQFTVNTGGTVTKTTFATGLSAPRSLSFDRSGNLFVGEFGLQRITKFTPAKVKTTFANTFVGGLAFEPPTSRLTNISTRASVQTGDRVTIAGFIVNGTAAKQVLVRGLGPTLSRPPFNVPGTLQDTTLELHKGSPVIAVNDNWQTDANAHLIPTAPIDYRPSDSRESALLRTIATGTYTAILAGKNSATGIGLVEVYDFDAYSNLAELTNVSTRAFVGTTDAVTIGGFISSGGNNSVEVVIRGLGPTLAQPPFNVSGTLTNPTLTLKNANGMTVASNDNWKTSQRALIQVTGLQPPNDLESAILAYLPPAGYTAILSGVGGGTGIGLVEIYKVLR